MLCCMPENVIGLKHLVERDFVRDELLGGKLVLGNELQQHREVFVLTKPWRCRCS